MNKYPIYIVSKGRWENPLTAKFFKADGVKFKVLVEPQEYDNYCQSLGKDYVMALPFSNLGVGSYPARNFAWEDSIKNGYARHWVFDDNINKIRRVFQGKKIPCNALIAIKVLEDFTDRYVNVGITAFNYSTFVVPGSSDKKPFYLNVHAYSAMLMRNDMPFRWRMKYNEDVDLCLQVLENKLCTLLFNAFTVDKTSTAAKMKGGNQTELYQGNNPLKKVQKARSLEEIWPQYVKVIFRFHRPHHFVDWKKHFTHGLIRNPNFNWQELEKVNDFGLKLKAKKEIKNEGLRKLFKNSN